MSHTQGWYVETNRGVKFSQFWNSAAHNCKSSLGKYLFKYESSRVHKVCAIPGAHLRVGKYVTIFLAFSWFFLDHTIWKMSRHLQFHRMCAAHLAHLEYTPLSRVPARGSAAPGRVEKCRSPALSQVLAYFQHKMTQN